MHIEGLDTLPPQDQAAVGKTMAALTRAFRALDADALDGAYAEDADWVNAFGSVKKGNAEIVEYLRGLFADANFAAGNHSEPPTVAVRRVGDDAVVVSIRQRIEGQGLIGGGKIAVRDNHSLHVLHRELDGRWLIVSEMFMDAREDASYAGHS